MENTEGLEDRGKIIEKVRQMMRIADPENGGFAGEIATASAMIQKLIDKYCIEEYELRPQLEEEASFESLVVDILFGKAKAWQLTLASSIGQITHTRVYTSHSCTYHNEMRKFSKYNEDEFTSGRLVNFYGRPENVKMAVELFTTWVFRLDEMASAVTSAYCEHLLTKYQSWGYTSAYRISGLGSEHPNCFRNSWLAGCMNAIHQKVLEQERSRSTSESSALIIYDTQLNQKWDEFSKKFSKSVSVGYTRSNGAAYSAGYQTGSSLNLTSKSLASG